MSEVDPLAGIRLTDFAERLFTFGEIAAEIGANPDTLRTWFNSGGLALFPPLDEVAEKGGRGASHRLHWRSVAVLLLAMKLNAWGLGLRSGEAAAAAGAAFTAGLQLEHLCSTAGPLIAVTREADGVRVALIDREAPVGLVEDRDAGGSFLVDPIGLGRIIWRCGMAQLRAEFEAEFVEAFTVIPAEDWESMVLGEGADDLLGKMVDLAATIPDHHAPPSDLEREITGKLRDKLIERELNADGVGRPLGILAGKPVAES